MEPTIHKQPSIYKNGLELKKIIDEIKKDGVIKFKLLPKYENNVQTSEWESYPLDFKIKENVGIFIFSLPIHIISSFTPTYSAEDIVGSNDWPAIGYFEYPRDVVPSGFFQVCEYPNGTFKKYEITRYGDKDYIAVRLNANQALDVGYLWLYNMTIPV